MKYFLIEIAEGDKKIEGKAIYQYEIRDLAIANFHSKLGSAMKSDLYKSEQVIVLNSANGVEAAEKWDNKEWVDPNAIVPEPQIEPEVVIPTEIEPEETTEETTEIESEETTEE